MGIFKKGIGYGILLSPNLSEKSARDEARGAYTFAVSLKATKPEIRKSIEAIYGVRPVKVRVSHIEGKITRSGKAIGRRSDWKKAIVTLPKGKTISIHTGV